MPSFIQTMAVKALAIGLVWPQMGTKRWFSCEYCHKVWPAGEPTPTVAELMRRRDEKL